MANPTHFALRRCLPSRTTPRKLAYNSFSSAKNDPQDPRVSTFGPTIKDTYATIRSKYLTPRNHIVLAHGLLGFDELHLAGAHFPGIHYWRGIKEALTANNISVLTASVPASASIESRAARLRDEIALKADGKSVNIIAHSMGGLDARYMISCLDPPNVKVLSLTTIASPHRGSAFADYIFDQIGPERLPKVYGALRKLQIETGAFSQLTRGYMCEEFNPKTPDKEGVRYFSYGAMANPSLWSTFRVPHQIVMGKEGENDGLVSVESSRWGDYKGTLVGVSHLDLINWTNRLKWFFGEMRGEKRNFNAIAFYLDIADMLAKEGF